MSLRRMKDHPLFRGHALTGPAGTAHGPAVDLKPSAVARTGTDGSGAAHARRAGYCGRGKAW
jgi:hypothetical protein